MYSTPDDMKLLAGEYELVQLAGDAVSAVWEDDATQAVLAEAIDQADGEIDGYIGTVMALPLTTVPRIVTNLSAKIAVYNLMRRRPEVPDHWQGEYKRCLDMLKAIARGDLSLGLTPDQAADAGQIGPVVVHGREPNLSGDDVWQRY